MELKPGYKKTEVGVIPEDWEVNLISDFADCTAGGTPLTNVRAYWGGQIRWMNSGELNLKRVAEVNGRITDVGLANSSAKLLPPNSVLIGLAGQGKTRGTVAINLVELCTNQSIATVLPNDLFVPEYLYFNLDARYDELRELSSGGGGRGGLNLRLIKSLKTPLPPVDEQRAIATVLSDMDSYIESLAALITKKRLIKQGAMQELLTGKRRLPGFQKKPGYKKTEVGMIPEDWEVVKAGDIGRFRGGSGFPTKFQGATAGEYPFFKVSDMNNAGNETVMETANNYISEVLRKHLGVTAFPAESIVFAKVGAAVFLERKKILGRASCLDNNMAAFVVDASRADFRFVHFVLLNTNLGNLVSATALPSLSGSVLSAIELHLPPLHEQNAIATVLSDMDSEIEALESKLSKARDLKQGMMQELLTGRIRLV